MKFYLANSAPIEGERKNLIVLYHSSWDDWFEFETSYSLRWYDENGDYEGLGSIKVGQKKMTSGQRVPDLPDEFETLDDNFFSLGQDVSYYENLNNVSDDFLFEVLRALNDIALDEDIYKASLKERVTKVSLLRSVSQTSVEGQFRRLAAGNSELTPYSFTFHPRKNLKSTTESLKLDFDVIPNSNPPSNVNVIIGRNGVGKTHLFNSMISSLITGNKTNSKHGYFTDSINNRRGLFANLISISFSAFDDQQPIEAKEEKDKTKNLNYSYIGLKKPSIRTDENGRKRWITKSPTILKNEFVKSVEKCKEQGKKERWVRALETLENDPIFKEAKVSDIAKVDKPHLKEIATNIFKRFSSGHKIVLLTITRLIETLEERSLVLLDEPEGYLHPPLLSAFIRALSDLLITRNAVAIIGTHSPVVLQEVPRGSVWKLRRHGANSFAERLEIESFGENVGLLTQEVFGLEVTDSGFHNILKSIANASDTYEEAIEKLNNQLGQEGRAILKTLMFKNEKNS